jgi:two-component system, LytTR family, response regulator
MRFRTLIVEDEEHSRNRIRRLLAPYTEDIEIIGEAGNGPEAVVLAKGIRPDLLFLDINLPGLDGFQMLGDLDFQPAVIFTTASNQHALEAFKVHAIDYLLKPIDEDELRRSVEKLRRLGFNPMEYAESIRKLAAAMGAQYLNRLTCKVGDRLFLVKVSEVIYFRSENKYTSVVTSGKTFVIDTPLVDLERKLNPEEFIRIHRSSIVNASWISEIRKGFDGKAKVVLLDKQGTELAASRLDSETLKPL